MKWLAGGDNYDSGVLELEDGTLLAKEYEFDKKSGVKRTWRLLLLGIDRKKEVSNQTVIPGPSGLK